MINPLYNQIRNLTLQLAEATNHHNSALANETRDLLKALCERHAGTQLDHPFQWETLGDLSESDDEAIAAYQKGYDCAERIGLPEYAEKIKFAMAETYFDKENIFEAHRLASEAAAESYKTNNSALKRAVNVFFGSSSHA